MQYEHNVTANNSFYLNKKKHTSGLRMETHVHLPHVAAAALLRIIAFLAVLRSIAHLGRIVALCHTDRHGALHIDGTVVNDAGQLQAALGEALERPRRMHGGLVNGQPQPEHVGGADAVLLGALDNRVGHQQLDVLCDSGGGAC